MSIAAIAFVIFQTAFSAAPLSDIGGLARQPDVCRTCGEETGVTTLESMFEIDSLFIALGRPDLERDVHAVVARMFIDQAIGSGTHP